MAINWKAKKTWFVFIIAVFSLSCCTVVFVLPVVHLVRDSHVVVERARTMRLVGDSINRHLEEKKVMPINLAELLRHVSDPKAKERLENGEIEVVWSAELYVRADVDPKNPTGSAMIAWEARPGPRNTRMVLLQDDTVVSIHEDNFRNATKAKTVTAKK